MNNTKTTKSNGLNNKIVKSYNYQYIEYDNKKDGIDFINDILKKIRNYIGNRSKVIFRGVSKDYSPKFIKSGASVRLGGEWDYSQYLAYVRGLITEAKRNYPETYANWMELEILGDLQHNGAGTCLVDFSRNMLISLWFACGETKDNSPGILYCYDINEDLYRRNSLKVIKDTDLNKPIEKLLLETKHITNFCSDTEYSFFMWTPSNLNNRIARQDSVFIFGFPKFDIREHSVLEIEIASECKAKIRKALQFYFDVNNASIFNDRHGFATVNDKLTSLPNEDDNSKRGNEEMLKGNYKIALDFFIMDENEDDNTETTDENKIIESAELHLSKALCYKYLDKEDSVEHKYIENAIREYEKARDYYEKALKNSSPDKTEICARKLLRTSNDVIQLLYLKKDYKRCQNACDEAIKKIKLANYYIHTETNKNCNIKKPYKDIYCKLSKLELLILIYCNHEREESDDFFNKWLNDWEDNWKKDWSEREKNLKKEWDKFLNDDLNNNWKDDWSEREKNLKNNWENSLKDNRNIDWENNWEIFWEDEREKFLKNKDIKFYNDWISCLEQLKNENNMYKESEFDRLLYKYFILIGRSITSSETDNSQSDNKEIKLQNDIKDFDKEIDETFNNKEDNVPYSAWDFTEIYNAISKAKELSSTIKSKLIGLTAHMISIRDKYNIRELNSNKDNSDNVFDLIDLKAGVSLTFDTNKRNGKGEKKIKVKYAGENKVEYKNKIWSMSAFTVTFFAKDMLDRSAPNQELKYFKKGDKTLWDIMNERRQAAKK